MENRTEHNPDITMQIQFMHDEQLCTIINIDFKHKQIYIENQTDRVLWKAFGVVEKPDWEQFEYFLESRCFPRTRANAKEMLKELGIDSYDPLQIIEKTKGRMAEDHHWLKILYKKDFGGAEWKK
ncbi:Uncharacterised protein [uncultured Roseburia sp.]|uniref:LAGLIDADG homing endonuclease n=1 Tax=Brotonthovivens ammoniilytica TaxID=2981725 RepID=A0ABT2TK71_9FIRM|nr:hypothetical protein [Brotonthovivens ammoniilytica]MCU6762603.1 hypothetical protein [Brotonthovivens ammoniilytica]SCI77058.1 Uncharacterised protein [uncultured Roseburia sp.]